MAFESDHGPLEFVDGTTIVAQRIIDLAQSILRLVSEADFPEAIGDGQGALA
jgi:hypothetical protein